MGIDNEGMRLFADHFLVRARSDDRNRHAEKDALTAASIVPGWHIGGKRRHKARRPQISVLKAGEGVKRRKVLGCVAVKNRCG
jgi:hypothetical protein